MEYSLVTSVYQDGYLARAFCLELQKTFSVFLATDRIQDRFEIIFVNDGSSDDSLNCLLDLKSEFKFVKVVDLSRNFGQHAALACGFRLATGHYILRMNIDLQDPPTEIPKLIDEMSSGKYDLVVGQYKVRNSSWSNRITALIYFEMFKVFTGLHVPQSTSPLRVMSRRFIDAYNELSEKTRFPQGLDQWLGFKHKYVEIDHHPRLDGKSSYSFKSRIQLALTGMLYFTDRPLILVGLFGLWMAVIGIFMGVLIIIEKLLGNSLLPGYASLASIALTGFGIQIGCIGLLGLYIGRIFREVQNRPLYIVREIY